VLFRFVSILRVEPSAAKQRAVTLRLPQSRDRLWGLPCLEYDGFVVTARSGRRKPRTQSYRVPITLFTTPQSFIFLPTQNEWVFLFALKSCCACGIIVQIH
jgi:hypothetical protein